MSNVDFFHQTDIDGLNQILDRSVEEDMIPYYANKIQDFSTSQNVSTSIRDLIDELFDTYCRHSQDSKKILLQLWVKRIVGKNMFHIAGPRI